MPDEEIFHEPVAEEMAKYAETRPSPSPEPEAVPVMKSTAASDEGDVTECKKSRATYQTMVDMLSEFAAGADLNFFKLPGCEDATEVHYSHDGDAGLNVYPYFKEARQTLAAGQRVSYRTGTGVSLPAGTVLLAHPRSGMAKKTGITVLNSPGTIDQPFQGEIEIILINHSDEDFTVERDRPLAQLVWLPVLKAKPKYGPPPTERTTRGTGGFGSTG